MRTPKQLRDAAKIVNDKLHAETLVKQEEARLLELKQEEECYTTMLRVVERKIEEVASDGHYSVRAWPHYDQAFERKVAARLLGHFTLLGFHCEEHHYTAHWDSDGDRDYWWLEVDWLK